MSRRKLLEGATLAVAVRNATGKIENVRPKPSKAQVVQALVELECDKRKKDKQAAMEVRDAAFRRFDALKNALRGQVLEAALSAVPGAVRGVAGDTGNWTRDAEREGVDAGRRLARIYLGPIDVKAPDELVEAKAKKDALEKAYYDLPLADDFNVRREINARLEGGTADTKAMVGLLLGDKENRTACETMLAALFGRTIEAKEA